MPNIAILNFCNLKCPYCFADDMIQEKSTAITLDNFRRILEFCSKSPENHIGIIGGEPTIHPEFDEILKEVNKYCREVNTGATLFTNGIELDKHLPNIGDRIGLLINCNSPKTVKSEYYNKMLDTIEHLASLSWFDRKANLGCNIYPGLEDYSYFWEIVDKYRIDHARISVVSPGGIYTDMRKDKELYFAKMKPIFLNFCKDAKKHHCKCHLDCGHIPECYFSMEEKDLVREVCDNFGSDFCEPVIDITPDFHVTSCFGCFDDSTDIRDFNDVIELRRYLFSTKTLPRAKANCTGKCTTCQKAKLLQCSCGCLGFSQIDKYNC